MPHERYETVIETSEGRMLVHGARPSTGRRAPLVVIYMDVNGIRDELKRVAGRFADAGFNTVLPDLYYRFGEGVAFDHRTPIHARPQAEIDRILELLGALTDDLVLADTDALIDGLFERGLADRGPAGCVGYCMGGRHVVRAMTERPDTFAAGAAHFPTYVVTEAHDAPYRSLGKATGKFYFCLGGRDHLMSAADVAILHDALDEAGTAYELKLHPEAGHAYAFSEREVGYAHEAAEYDWERTIALFHAKL